jgi:uncharacterized membrane protein
VYLSRGKKEKETIMNRQELGINVKTGLTGCGPACHEIRSVSATRVWSWLVDGFRIARAQPLMWIVTILGSADLATAFELAAPFQLLATLLLAVLAGATVLTPAGNGNPHQWSIGATFRVLVRNRNALFTVALACAAIVVAGELLSFALLHIKLTTRTVASGAHSLSIIFGESSDRAGSLQTVLNAMVLAIAIAAVWFAPALIILQRAAPLEAMSTSLRAVFHNGPVALLYAGVLAADALLAAAMPMFVRGLVLTPAISALILLSMHGSYNDILSIGISRED